MYLLMSCALAFQVQVGLPMLMLMRDLIVQLHSEEEDEEAVILVFLPTYALHYNGVVSPCWRCIQAHVVPYQMLV